MVNNRKTLSLTLLLHLFINYKVFADTLESPCILLNGCNCHITLDKAHQYHCPTFIALLKNANDLKIRCNSNRFTNQSEIDFEKLMSQGLQKLTILNCPVEFFMGNAIDFGAVRILTLSDSNIESIDLETLIKSIPNLTELEIRFSQINLSGGLFSNNPPLETLNLAHNNLKILPAKFFDNVTKLVHLDLSGNEIPNLPDAVFLQLRSLKYLNLKMNKLTEINSMLLYNLQHLEELDLSYNEIIGIHIEAFQRLINLKVINLRYNFVEFDGFSPLFSNLNLERADLSHNRISQMVNDLVLNKIYLDKLDLSFNEIYHIELSNLLAVSRSAKINLQNNKITSIDFTDADLIDQLNALDNNDLPQKYHAVTTININENPIICDCNLHDFIKFLKRESASIQFEVNKAKCALPQYLTGLPLGQLQLDVLVCEMEPNTCPKNCQCNYRHWDKTVIVDCANRQLTEVPDLHTLNNIDVQNIEVHLQNNILTFGPQDGMGYDNVTKLIMSHNKIQDITWIPPTLEVLEVEDNNISSLKYEALLQLNSPTIKNLVLGNNPWKCDCSAVVLHSFLTTELTSKQIDVEKIQCSNNQKLLIYLNSEGLCSLNSSNISIIVLIVSLLILGLSIAIIVTIICYLRKNSLLKRSRMV